jgi:hypothetical protein
MKTMITAALVAAAMLPGIETPVQSNQEQLLEMHLLADDVFENRIKIYDFQGNFLSEMRADDVAYDEITVTDYLMLESSGFAFKYLGDYYYLMD